MALGKSLFAVKFFSKGPLPRAALGKAFAEGFWAFAECPEPSANRAPPVVVVCRPTELGGLGILDFRFSRFALRLRWEWLRRAVPGRCWAALPAKMEKPVSAMTARLGDGSSTWLWTDSWATVGPFHRIALAPALYRALSRTGKTRTVKDGLFQNRWARDIVGASTTQVLCQYLVVWQLLLSVQLNPLQADRFVWKWWADGKYSASSAYRASSPARRRYWEPRSFGRRRRRPK